jgi:hypothetical protein
VATRFVYIMNVHEHSSVRALTGGDVSALVHLDKDRLRPFSLNTISSVLSSAAGSIRRNAFDEKMQTSNTQTIAYSRLRS